MPLLDLSRLLFELIGIGFGKVSGEQFVVSNAPLVETQLGAPVHTKIMRFCSINICF